MKVLIVGGLGFIGHWVVRKLEDRDIECQVVDCEKVYSTQNSEWMKRVFDSRARQIKSPVHDFDILDGDKVKHLLVTYQPTHIIFLASPPNQSAVETDITQASRVMIEGLNNFLRYRSTQRFTFVSSSMVYGDFSEPVTEESPTNPINSYGILKLAGENLVRSVNIPYTIIRPSAVYGPRDSDDRVIARWLQNATQDLPLVVHGENERCDFTWVGDLAWGIVEATLSEKGKNETFNLTRGGAVSLSLASEIVSKITKSESAIVIKEKTSLPSRDTLDITKASELLNFNPSTDIETGIKLYYLWLKQYDSENSIQQS